MATGSPVLPEGFEVVATSENAPYAAIAVDERRRYYYHLMFHPEVVHTPRRRPADRQLPVHKRGGA